MSLIRYLRYNEIEVQRSLRPEKIRQQLHCLPLSAGETIIKWTDRQISFVSCNPHAKNHIYYLAISNESDLIQYGLYS